VGGLGLHWRLSGSSRTILRVSTGRTCPTGAFDARETGCPQKVGSRLNKDALGRPACFVWRVGAKGCMTSFRASGGFPRSIWRACSLQRVVGEGPVGSLRSSPPAGLTP
jgi:hypothetical protein